MNYSNNVPQDKIHEYRRIVVSYYKKHGRKHLPWRKTKDPWKILLAEMLLRKTTAEQVKPVYLQLKDLGPSVLKDYPKDELELLLHPLGIYRERARLLKLVGAEVAQKGKDKLDEWDFIVSLPGAGRYTANMVLSTAFGKRKPGLDSNMIRVLARVFSIISNKTRARTDQALWEAAEKIMPHTEVRAYNWGVMDLAAALCRPSNPLCDQCPINDICDFASKSRIN